MMLGERERMTEQYGNILVERRGRVGLVTLNRPQALNALNTALMNELVDAVTAMDTDPDIGAVVITGSAKAFAAGADIILLDNFDNATCTEAVERVKKQSTRPILEISGGLSLERIPGVGQSRSLSVYVCNNGGQTQEREGQAARALGEWLEHYEATGLPVPQLKTLRQHARAQL